MTKPDRESSQIEFNRLVNRGVILGLVWILGVGSVIALISGFQAKKILKEADYKIEGKEKIKRCFIIGIGGLLVWVIAILIILVFRKK
ncbi:MAG: hypothetical protein ABI840_12115 [bacterium]